MKSPRHNGNYSHMHLSKELISVQKVTGLQGALFLCLCIEYTSLSKCIPAPGSTMISMAWRENLRKSVGWAIIAPMESSDTSEQRENWPLEAYVTFEEHFCFKLFLCEVKSSESVQVKLGAIEIEVHFTILLENCGEDLRLLMNDLSNLLRTKESMARNYSDNNWSWKFRYEPLIKVMLRSILHCTKFPENISKLFLNEKKKKNGTNDFRSHYIGRQRRQRHLNGPYMHT